MGLLILIFETIPSLRFWSKLYSKPTGVRPRTLFLNSICRWIKIIMMLRKSLIVGRSTSYIVSCPVVYSQFVPPKLPFEKFVILNLGTTSAGKSSFVNYFFSLQIKKEANAQQDSCFTIVETVPENVFSSYMASQT